MLIRNSIFSLCFILLVSCEKKDSKLYGTWEADKTRTFDQLTQKYTLTQQQIASFDSFLGNSQFTYNKDGTGLFVSNRDQPDKYLSTEFSFEVIGTSESQVVIKNIQDSEYTDQYPYTIFRFESPDSYSVIFRDDITGIVGQEFYTRKN